VLPFELKNGRYLAWPAILFGIYGVINQHPLRTKEGGGSPWSNLRCVLRRLLISWMLMRPCLLLVAYVLWRCLPRICRSSLSILGTSLLRLHFNFYDLLDWILYPGRITTFYSNSSPNAWAGEFRRPEVDRPNSFRSTPEPRSRTDVWNCKIVIPSFCHDVSEKSTAELSVKASPHLSSKFYLNNLSYDLHLCSRFSFPCWSFDAFSLRFSSSQRSSTHMWHLFHRWACESQILGNNSSFDSSFIGLTVLSHCLSRCIVSEDLSTWSSIRQIRWTRLLILLVFVDSWLFLFSSE